MAANPFMMDDSVPAAGASSNPFGNPFFDVGGSAPTVGASAVSNPFLMGVEDEVGTQPAGIFNPFAAPVDSAPDPAAGDGLAWLSSGGAMRHDASPYDLPDSSLMTHSTAPTVVDDLLEEDIPLPEELMTVGPNEVATPSPQASPIPSSKLDRPTPPPRPPSRPSPPHETQKLILSVTGAMQVSV